MFKHADTRRRPRARAGLTLVELMVASTIMALIVGGMAALAMTVEAGGEHGRALATTLQHAEVVTERIERTLLDAHTSNEFPGFFVIADSVGGHDFPDTLIVWSPESEPNDPDGAPRFDELVVYTPDPDEPHRLLELTARQFPLPTPPISDTLAWRVALSTLRSSDQAERVTLTNRLRTADDSASTERGAIRFATRYTPSDTDLASYPSTTDWDELPWVHDVFSNSSGRRQAWCRFELQLVSKQSETSTAETALPFFGSAAIYYPWKK